MAGRWLDRAQQHVWLRQLCIFLSDLAAVFALGDGPAGRSTAMDCSGHALCHAHGIYRHADGVMALRRRRGGAEKCSRGRSES